LHHLSSGSNYADLEFLAGYIALRKLNDPARALTHFRNLRVAVSGPISLSRAAYWEGRAQEALDRPVEARAAYAFAAEFQTAFYGLLAAERAGLPFDARLAGGEAYPDWRALPAARSSVFEAAVMLRAAGQTDLAERFLLHLAEGLDGQEIGALAGLALDWQEWHMALMLAKAAADKGVIWPTAYFPVTGLVGLDLPVAPELSLSIARRESEFDPKVVSPAGARGLMQVMPGTAKMMAPKVGLPYEAGRLTTDPVYNAKLGSAYLAELVAEFGAVPALVAAGYNAGPGRPRRWVEELGDPRTGTVDVVDWIEHIPFTETRNYVMRVGESLPIYRARLGRPDAVPRLSQEMAGR
jgi:soluble lytic murein transglycosylase